MLDEAPPVSRDETEWTSPRGEGSHVSLAELMAALKRSIWTIALCVLLSLALAVVYLINTPSTYLATAQLLIEPAKQRLVAQDSNLVDLTIDNAQVESQVEVLRSERVVSDVIEKLGLANDPEFRSDAAQSDYERNRTAVVRFKNGLSTRRLGQSYVIEISFRSTDPEKAARIANAITEAYMRDQLRAKTELAQQASEWMQQRVTELGVQLNAAAAAVQKFRAANGIVDTGTGQTRLLDQLTELEARAQAYRKLYESYVQRLTENRQQESFPVSNARVIAEASTPLARNYPKTSLTILLALLVGLLLGAGVAAARTALDGSVRTVRQIRHSLGLDCIGSLPRFRSLRLRPAAPYAQVLDAPFSSFAEAMRGVRISLQAVRPDKATLRIGVISFAPGEGATTVAASLAALSAISGAKTLLIDANLREPTASRRLAPGSDRGIVEALETGPQGAFVLDPRTTAYILPAVSSEHVADSADLLASPAMRQFLHQLEGIFATVIVDLPALASAVDARAIGPQLDGCLLVVEWGRTPLEALAEAAELLRASRTRLFGVVINKVETGVPTLFGLEISGRRPPASRDRLRRDQAVAR